MLRRNIPETSAGKEPATQIWQWRRTVQVSVWPQAAAKGKEGQALRNRLDLLEAGQCPIAQFPRYATLVKTGFTHTLWSLRDQLHAYVESNSRTR